MHRVGPVPFRIARFPEAVTAVLGTAEGVRAADTGVAVHFANAYTIALADSDPDYAALLARPGSAVFTDGMPVAWVGRRAYPERRPGCGIACTDPMSWKQSWPLRLLRDPGTSCWAARPRRLPR